MSNPFFSDWFVDAAARHVDGSIRWTDVPGIGAFPVRARLRRGAFPWPANHAAPGPHCFLGAPIEGRGERSGRDLFVRNVPAGSAGHARLAAHPDAIVVGTRQRACLSARGTFEAFESRAFSGKKRKERRRLARRLAEAGTVSEGWSDGRVGLEGWADDFLALEAMGWKGEAGTALGAEPAHAAFFRDALGGAARAGALHLYRRDLDGRAVAMLVCFSAGDEVFAFKIAHDPRFARFSPGVEAMVALSRLVLDGGRFALADSCAAEGHPMIDALWPERRVLNDWFVPLTTAGRVVAAPLLQRRFAQKSSQRRSLDSVPA